MWLNIVSIINVVGGLLMRWLSLFLACQHLNSGTNLRECEDQSWFKVQAVPVFRSDWCKMPSVTPRVWAPQVAEHCSTLARPISRENYVRFMAPCKHNITMFNYIAQTGRSNTLTRISKQEKQKLRNIPLLMTRPISEIDCVSGINHPAAQPP
jgi:hypothetical protein